MEELFDLSDEVVVSVISKTSFMIGADKMVEFFERGFPLDEVAKSLLKFKDFIVSEGKTESVEFIVHNSKDDVGYYSYAKCLMSCEYVLSSGDM
ncbi:hypothetical protein vBVpaMR16F_216 [Vibrio phage vB_VpaM_R16F]|nr:hypothetical protein vBVpaMR16F_216 [Vibrio phage vB_VpaM_R16F]